MEKLKKKQKESRDRLEKQCEVITGIRKRSAEQLRMQIIQSLEELNFLDVCFEISFEKTPEPTAGGQDAVTFLISTNPGSPVRPLQMVASGGELSRIMLGIKTIMARRDSIGTLIFDEIDTGISGRTAQKVSEKMAQLSESCQVIAITHLAQIAAIDFKELARCRAMLPGAAAAQKKGTGGRATRTAAPTAPTISSTSANTTAASWI